MNNNNFLKHFAIIGGGTLINMLLGLLTTLIITRIVDPSEYGQLSIFTMYSNVAVMILCLGLDQALVRFYYEGTTLEFKKKLLFQCINLPVIVTMIAAFLFIILIETGIIHFEFEAIISILLSVYVFIILIYRFSQLLLRLEYNSKLYSGLNIAKKAIYVVSSVLLIKIIGKNYLLILIVVTIVADGVCMGASIIAQRKTWNFLGVSKSACTISQKEILRYGLPFIVTLGITTLFQTIDKISLNIYCTYTEVGIYASTMTLVNIFAIIQTTFNSLWSPIAVEHYTKEPNDTQFYKKAFQIITVIMFFLGISLILIREVFAILLGEKYREAAYILPFLIFNPIMYTISEVTVGGLVFKKKSKQQMIVAFGACLVNIVGNTILVPKLGCKGAAISTGIAYIVFYTLRTVLSNKYYKVDYNIPKFYLLTFVVATYAFYSTFIKFNVYSIIGYFICLFVLIALYKETISYIVGYAKKFIVERIKTKV